MHLEQPLVSIVIPTFNRAATLKRALASILHQTYHNTEIIVVDGPSNDGTEEVVKGFGRNIRYIKEMVPKGAGAARNKGLKAARGEYIAFQDSDNEWIAEKLEKQMKEFASASKETGVVYTGYLKINGIKKEYYPQKYIRKKEGDIHEELLVENFIGCQTIVAKIECFARAGEFDENLPTNEDWELFLRISKYYHFACIDEPMVLSYIQPDSISADLGKIVIASKSTLKAHYEEYSRSRHLLSHFYFNNIGTILCENGDHKEGRRYIIKAIKLNPGNLRYYLLLILSLLGHFIYTTTIKASRLIKRKS